MVDSRRSRVQQEIGQTVPFQSASQEAVIAIGRTADALRRRLEQVLAPLGITPQQYNVLRILRGARGKPLPTLEIGQRMVERTPGVTRLIDRLVAKGLVRREGCPHDRRVVYCLITAEGLALLKDAEPAVDAFDNRVGQALGDEEIHGMIDALDRVRTGMEAE